MDQLQKKTAEWLVDMCMSGLLLTPALALLKLALPVPWVAVFIPWAGVAHLLLCWYAGGILGGFLYEVYTGLGRR